MEEMNEIIRTENGPLENQLEQLREMSQTFLENAVAENTKKAYKNDWHDFSNFCEQNGLLALPANPETVVLYLTHLVQQGKKTSTMQRRISSISQAHQANGMDSPTHSFLVKKTWAGIRRTLGTEEVGKEPVLADDVKEMIRAIPDTLIGIRDRALLLVGFSGAFRRSELVGLDVSDLRFSEDGLRIRVKRSKTDQEAEGFTVGIHRNSLNVRYCPVYALEEWLREAGIVSGPVFRAVGKGGVLKETRLTGQEVARAVKKYARAIGLDESRYAGHSLRSGFATTAARRGKSERAIRKQTGHKTDRMLQRYIREGSLFLENASAGILE